MPTACTLEEIRQKVNDLDSDVDVLWNRSIGASNASVYIATGNIGVPVVPDDTSKTNDLVEYSRGAAIINSQNPNGIFILGDANFDQIEPDLGVYDIVNMESKIVFGFSNALLNRSLFPVMGDLDYWGAEAAFGDLVTKMDHTYLSLFDYLSDAERYYEVYDDVSNTSFFVLSSGRFTNYYNQVDDVGFVYADDFMIDGDQYLWFVDRIANSPAKNKVVLFHHPFLSPATNYDGEDINTGEANTWEDFSDWPFEALGVKLIINGHTGNSFHLKKGAVNVVNASAFARSRFGLTEVASAAEPPEINTVYGKQGFVLEYFSHQPMGSEPTNVEIPNEFKNYVIPKNEFFKMTCTKEGITCEFISYDPYISNFASMVEAAVVEHSFSITANE